MQKKGGGKLILRKSVQDRRQFLLHKLWLFGVENVDRNESLVELERLYIKHQYNQLNKK